MNNSHDYPDHQRMYHNFTRAIGIGIIGTTILLILLAVFLV